MGQALGETERVRRNPRGRNVGRAKREIQVSQDLPDRAGLDDRGDHLEFASAPGAVLQIDGENSGQEFSPAVPASFLGFGLGLCISSGGGRLDKLPFLELFLGDDLGADFRVRGQAAEEPGEMSPGWGHDGRKFFHELQS